MSTRTRNTASASTVAIASALLALAAFALSACSDQQDAITEPSPTETTQTDEAEEAVNPDITPEQTTFVQELLAEPLPQDEATARIEEAGYVWRLGTIDGEPQAVTMDYRTDRLTLTTDNGLVTDATWG